jgi:hypothetical protein
MIDDAHRRTSKDPGGNRGTTLHPARPAHTPIHRSSGEPLGPRPTLEPQPAAACFASGLLLVLLTVAFRSVVAAGTAIVLNLLSVGAAYGLLVLVFQQGVGAGVFGLLTMDSVEAS